MSITVPQHKINGNRNGRWDWQCKKGEGEGRKCQANLGQVSRSVLKVTQLHMWLRTILCNVHLLEKISEFTKIIS